MPVNMAKKVCTVCGKEFIGANNALYCSIECKKKMYHDPDGRMKHKKKPKKDDGKKFTNAVVEAKKMGLSYGQYMAWRNANECKT